MKKMFLILFSMNTCSSLISFSQNLILNYSFEQFNACPDTAPSISSAKYWVNPTMYSPDYFNSCDTNFMNNGIPGNEEGFQFAKTGNAYAGIITCNDTSGIGIDEREYIQTTLTDTLISGKKYCVEFYISAGDSSPFAANNIGAYFSKTAISYFSTEYLPYSPQVSNNPVTNPLTNRIIWTEVSGTFIAQGGEKYITIGNFNDNASTDTTNHPDPSQWESYSYHYIDDVSVYLCDSIDGIIERQKLEIFFVYPNPSSGAFNLQFNEKNIREILIYNLAGEIVIYLDDSKANNISIDLSAFSKGLYFLKVRTQGSIFYKKLFLNN